MQEVFSKSRHYCIHTLSFYLYQDELHSNHPLSDSNKCKSGAQDVNHAVLLVGYDTEEKSYTIKNSWGSSWGLEGYFKIRQGVNMCGVSDCASYPIV